MKLRIVLPDFQGMKKKIQAWSYRVPGLPLGLSELIFLTKIVVVLLILFFIFETILPVVFSFSSTNMNGSLVGSSMITMIPVIAIASILLGIVRVFLL